MPEDRELRSLLLAGRSGDAGAYREFLSKLNILLQRFVGRRLSRLHGSQFDIEDIVQETLIAIHNKRHTYDGETPVMAWACAIARYKLVDSFRASKIGWDIHPFEEEDIADTLDGNSPSDAKITIDKGLAQLPERFRVPVELTKLQGLTAGEAAKQIGIPEATVRVNVHRGVKALMKLCGVRGRVCDENG